MCEIMEMERAEGHAEGLSQGLSQGLRQGRAETCKKMHDKGMSCDEIANLLDITCEDVEKALSLAEEL